MLGFDVDREMGEEEEGGGEDDKERGFWEGCLLGIAVGLLLEVMNFFA